MTTTEIRHRIHVAIGEPRQSAGLTDRVARRLAETSPRRTFGAYRVVAGLLAVSVIGALLLSRSLTVPQPAPVFKTNQVVGAVNPDEKLPPDDLAAAGVSSQASSLVTQLNLTAVSNGRTVRVIGAYADSARVVLIFRGEDPMFAVSPQVFDRTGRLNYGSGAGSGVPGDWVVTLMGPAHPDGRGIAHLNVAVDAYQTDPSEAGEPGTWNFSFDVTVLGARALALNPPLSSIGGWNLKLEAMEATPTVVRFQVLVDASASQVDSVVITLVDSSRHEVQKSSESRELTNAMFFFIVIGKPQTRVNVIWTRPPPGAYELRISAPGFDYKAALTIP